ncbi:MAG: rhombosortase [Myxococcota bacterium]
MKDSQASPSPADRLRGSPWRATISLAALSGLAQWGGPMHLRLQTNVAGYEPWRLVTAHFVHLTPQHAGLNLAVFALFTVILAELRRPRLLLSCGLISALSVDAGVLALHAEVEWYVGFSGVLYGLLTAGALAELPHHRALGVVVLVGLLIKLTADFAWGTPATTEAFVGGPVLALAHVYGALGGALAGLWFARQRW